jgi:hypothetical protein
VTEINVGRHVIVDPTIRPLTAVVAPVPWGDTDPVLIRGDDKLVTVVIEPGTSAEEILPRLIRRLPPGEYMQWLAAYGLDGVPPDAILADPRRYTRPWRHLRACTAVLPPHMRLDRWPYN